MGYPYSNAIGDGGAAAGWPAAVWTGVSVRNESLNGYAVAAEIIGSGVWTNDGGRWRAYLDQVPLEQSTFTAVDQLDSAVLTAIPWGETPGVDEVAVSLETGAVEVHATRSGHDVQFGYVGRGTSVGAGLLNRLQQELRAVQTELRFLRQAQAAGHVLRSGGGVPAFGPLVAGDVPALAYLPTAGGTLTGTLTVVAGTAAAPGLAFSGDTNTGIYRVAADAVGVATGGTGRVQFTTGAMVPLSNGAFALGGPSNYWGDAYLNTVFTNRVGVGGDGMHLWSDGDLQVRDPDDVVCLGIHAGGAGGYVPGGWTAATLTLSAQVSCSVYATAAQSVANATEAAVAFDAEVFDQGGCHSTSSNTSRLTAPVAGTYLVTATVNWAANATGSRVLILRVGGTTAVARVECAAASGTVREVQQVSHVLKLTAGQYVEAVVYQSSGGSLDVGAATVRNSVATFIRLH